MIPDAAGATTIVMSSVAFRTRTIAHVYVMLPRTSSRCTHVRCDARACMLSTCGLRPVAVVVYDSAST